jgi:hypothetical protein
LARGSVFTTLLLFVSILESVPSPLLATQTAPSVGASAAGARPTVIVRITDRARGSTLETVPSCRFATQIAPAAAVIAYGSLPTGMLLPEPASSSTMSPLAGATAQTCPNATVNPVTPTAPGNVCSTFPLPALRREIVPSAEFATHTFPLPYAIPVGPFPTSTLSTTVFVLGSIRETVPSEALATQTAFGLTATPAGEPPTEIVCRTLLVDGLTRATELSSVFATQIAPSPAAIPFGAEPTSMDPEMRPFFVSITPTSFGFTVAAAAPPRVRNVPRPAATAAATIRPPATSRLRETPP